MPLSAAIKGAAGVASSMLSAHAAKEMQKRQIEWERERATHAHQWEVEDLKAAGLNPILSAGGQGAATGGISAPQIDTSGIRDVGDALTTSAELEKTKKETETQEETAENIKKDTELKEMQKGEVEANTALKQAEKGLISEKTATEKIDRALKKAQEANVQAETKATLSKLGFEIQTLQAQAAQLRAERRYKEAMATEKTLDNKYYALNLIMNKLEQASRIGGNSAAAVKNIVGSLSQISDILPMKKGIGFLTEKMLKKK